MKLIDANVILRFLLNDVPEQSIIAKETITAGAFTVPEVIPEVVYVLTAVYSEPRESVGKILSLFIDNISVADKIIIKEALSQYASTSLDYVDCVLLARGKIVGDDVLTFDKLLLKKISNINQLKKHKLTKRR